MDACEGECDVDRECREAGYDRDEGQTLALHGEEAACEEARCRRDDASRFVKGCGEGHRREDGVGDVVEEGGEEAVCDLPSEEGEGEGADEVGRAREDDEVDPEVLHAASSSLASVFTGKRIAPSTAATIAQMLIVRPAGISERTGV